MGRAKRNKVGEKILAGHAGEAAATKNNLFRVVKGKPGAKVRYWKAGSGAKALRGGVLGAVQAEAIEGRARKLYDLGKTGVRVGKKVMDKFKTK